MRSGTVPHVLVVGLGAACEVCQLEMEVCQFIQGKKNSPCNHYDRAPVYTSPFDRETCLSLKADLHCTIVLYNCISCTKFALKE